MEYFKQFADQFVEDFIDTSAYTTLYKTPIEGMKKLLPKRYPAQWKLVKV